MTSSSELDIWSSYRIASLISPEKNHSLVDGADVQDGFYEQMHYREWWRWFVLLHKLKSELSSYCTKMNQLISFLNHI